MKQASFICTPEQIKTLQNQQFTDTQPGTLIKDFNTLLDFIGENGVVVSEKTQFLAMGLLAELNQRLSNPLDVKLKRPIQKSYPHINGLYLLLRSSGLAYLDGDGKKSKLMLNANILEQWQKLNPTEQYFFLLQVFYYHADTEIIGEKHSRFGSTAFFECLEFYDRDLESNLFEIKTPNDKEHIRYIPGLHNLALMELFGFVSVECDKNDETATWPVSQVNLTELGKTIISYFLQNKWVIEGGFFPKFIPNKKAKTRWEDELKKLMPNWKNSLREDNKTIAAPSEGCYVFKVSLGRVNRKLAVPSNISLDELAHGILNAFDFGDHHHLYNFIYKNQYGIEVRISDPYVEFRGDILTAEQYSVGSLPLYKGMILTFWFDFRVDWKFKIQVVEMPSPDLNFDDLTVIEKKGIPPKQHGW